MKNEIDIETDVFLALKESDLAGNVGGMIYKTARIEPSSSEDIVISALSEIPISQLQEVYLNVNIYVADIKRGNQYIKNAIRIKTLLDLSYKTLRTILGDGFRLSLTSQKVLPVNGKNEHFINNKVLYQICNS